MRRKRQKFEVTPAREAEIRSDMARWEQRTASQMSPHMQMCEDLLALLDDARDINSRMMAEKVRNDPAYQDALNKATA
jgi:hypothetical protein